jgi:hypothetical protein
MAKPRTISKPRREGFQQEGNVLPFQRALASGGAAAPSAAGGGAMLTGILVKIAPDGHVWVQLEGGGELAGPCCVRATALLRLASRDVGATLVLWLAPDALAIVLGRQTAGSADEQDEKPPIEALVDGRRVVLEAADEIVLRCGESSITLKRDGRVLIKGAYVETASRGVNRIKGGSVKIN